MCPECEAGKHLSCAGFAYDEFDREIPCGCPHCNPKEDQ